MCTNVRFPEQDWNGMRAEVRAGITLDTTGLFLRRTGNTVRDSVPVIPFVSDCPNRDDRSGLAFYEIYYERNLIPVDDAIAFRTHAAAGRSHLGDLRPVLGRAHRPGRDPELPPRRHRLVAPAALRGLPRRRLVRLQRHQGPRPPRTAGLSPADVREQFRRFLPDPAPVR